MSEKIRQEKSDPLRFSSFIHILKALFNLGMLANFQSNRKIGNVFTGLERSMMDFFGKNHHLGIFFLSLPNNVRLTSKLYRMHKNKSSTIFWVIRSRVEVHPGAIYIRFYQSLKPMYDEQESYIIFNILDSYLIRVLKSFYWSSNIFN